MPKNGNRGGKKPSISFAANHEDFDSNVVFGDAKTPRKPKQGSTTEGTAKRGGDNIPASSEDPPKKPDTRQLVSNISSLSECCQDGLNNMIGKRSIPLGSSLIFENSTDC